MKPPRAKPTAILCALICTLAAGDLSTVTPRITSSAEALPLYAARSGRTCDNCHADPTGWANPELPLRKCNLSCMTCHVNPTGGGLRTVSGRYYGQATLPMWFPSHRPWEDRNRMIPFIKLHKNRRNRLPEPAFGKPVGGSAPLAFDEERYNGLRADPLLLFGIDARYAFWLVDEPTATSYGTGEEGAFFFFPMQLDLHAAVHPAKWITAAITSGVLAKSRGVEATFQRRTPFNVKDAFVMMHQLHYMSYLRFGRFLPPFGTYTDDHTSPIRRDFELDHGQLHSRVTGLEFGLAPNYPFFSMAVFRPSERDTFAGDDPDNDSTPSFAGVGWGIAASGGWRDLGFGVGASVLVRRRDVTDGGNTEAVAVNWYLNPFHYLEWLPVTYLGEVALGARERELSGTSVGHIAALHELNVLVLNGLNVRAKYDFADPDMDILGDQYHRMSFGGDLMLLPGFGLRGEVRFRMNPGDQVSTSDGFFFIRGWY